MGALQRTVASNFRRWCFTTFGGRCWLHWLVAIGDITERLVDLVHAHIDLVIRRAALREQSTTAVPGPRLSVRSAAQRAVEEPPPHRGAHRPIAEGKALRKEARRFDNQIAREEQAYEVGRSTKSWREWRGLLQRREAPLG